MCGIVGFISKHSSEQIEKAIEKITHRGPDDLGVFSDDHLSLGFRRLAIQDLSANGRQPMFTADGRYCIIFNGEIYNHWDIRKDIEHKYNFQSTSDTETILYGYLEFGEAIFNKLNGIFALCIYDTETQNVIIARDQFGVKPLYYYHKDATFLFSSEIKAISDFPDLDKTIDYTALVNYLYFLWSPGEQTPLMHIKKLLPGHFIKLNAKTPHIFETVKFYEIPFNGKYSLKSEVDLIDELDKRLLKAVERQLLSDVPVGFFLSGGLDSSLIVAMAKKIKPDEKLRCYTIDANNGEDYEGFENDLQYAKQVAIHLDLDLQIVRAEPDIVHDFDKMIYHLDEPQADASPLNVLKICQQARKDGFVVLLGGTAGDDLFSGYRRHQALQYEKYFQHIPRFFLTFILKITSKLNSNNPKLRRIRKFLQGAEKNTTERIADFFCWTPLNVAKNLFNEDIKKQIGDYDPSKILLHSLENIPNEKQPLNKMLFWDLKYFLTDHNLNYTDKLSMAVGVEVRVPFLDVELLEFSTQIPVHLKLKGNTTKYLLKKVGERYLPNEIIYRPKTGFGAPVREWVLNDLKKTIDITLSKEVLSKQNIFNPITVTQLIEDNKKGKIDASYTIWSLLAIESWFRQFNDYALKTHETNNSKS